MFPRRLRAGSWCAWLRGRAWSRCAAVRRPSAARALVPDRGLPRRAGPPPHVRGGACGTRSGQCGRSRHRSAPGTADTSSRSACGPRRRLAGRSAPPRTAGASRARAGPASRRAAPSWEQVSEVAIRDDHVQVVVETHDRIALWEDRPRNLRGLVWHNVRALRVERHHPPPAGLGPRRRRDAARAARPLIVGTALNLPPMSKCGRSRDWGGHAASTQCRPELGTGSKSWPKPEPSAPL